MGSKEGGAQLRVYIATCVAAAVATGVIAALSNQGPIAWTGVLAFGSMGLLAEAFAVTTAAGTTYSVTFVVTIAAIATLGPLGAVLATLVTAVGVRDFRQRSLDRHLFNAAQLTVSAGAAAIAFHLIAADPSRLAIAIPAALFAAALNFTINTGLVAGAVARSSSRRTVDVWRDQYANLGGAYAAYAVLGVMLAVLAEHAGWLSIFFLLVPVLIARAAFQTAITLHDAFDRVVTTLVAAVEQKDPYTSGHAARVARLTERVALEYGRSPAQARRIRYAALMHDIGKLAVHNAVLQKDGKLTDAEYDHMRLHPERGVEVVSDVELLEPVLDGIRHHHERWDGNGYPDRLAGEAIPLVARLITVCDAFDAMTSTRVYRAARTTEAAFEELDRCAGTQFDPKVVRALKRTIARYGWQAEPERRVSGEMSAMADEPLPRRARRSHTHLHPSRSKHEVTDATL
ncbi:MAG: HD-GYP domain-containing protein [Actinomycetota bacterium]